MKPKCVVALALPGDIIEHLKVRYDVAAWSGPEAMGHEQLAVALEGAQGLLCALSTPVTAEIMDHAPELKVISTISVGVDHIDIAAATLRGIPVGHTPGVLVDSTADLAVALMLAATRRVAEADQWVREGQWTRGWQSDLLLGTDISQATVGLVGLGPIGEAVARRLRGFGCKLVGWNRTPKEVEGVEPMALDQVFETADIVSLHTALTDETRHIASRKRLALMRPGATLINTGRGPLVDEAALIEALALGRLRAGLDVFCEEPLPTDHPLLSLRNVVLLPHVGSATLSTRNAMVRRALENLHVGMRNERLAWCANPAVYSG
ncbi:MAG: D-glycerate dehydrogenase [Halieaceae bacterium]|jgi:glyoxylate reductase